MSRSILIADDDESFTSLLAAVLTQAGHRVETCSDPRVAFNRALRDPLPDLLLVDNVMPGLSGLELCAKVKAYRPSLPVVLITGRADSRAIRDYIRLKVNGIFLKPLNLPALIRRTNALLGLIPAEDRAPVDPGSLYGGVCPRSRQFLQDAAEAAGFHHRLVLIGPEGTDFQRVLRTLCPPQTPPLMLEASGFSPEVILRRWGESGSTSPLTVGLLEAMRLGRARMEELALLLSQTSPAIRCAYCVSRPPDDLLDSGTIDETVYLHMGLSDLTIPALEEVPEEIPGLARSYLQEAGRSGQRLSRTAEAYLMAEAWPGNHLQLRDVILSAAHLAGAEIGPEEIAAARLTDRGAQPAAGAQSARGSAIRLAPGAEDYGHILVVDDEPAYGHLIGEILTGAGYQVRVMTDPHRALQSLQDEPCDLLLTDFRMPAMDGGEFLRQARQLYPRLPAIFISGWMSPRDLAETANLGIDLALEKPTDPDTLLRAVRNVFQIRTPRLPLPGERVC